MTLYSFLFFNFFFFFLLRRLCIATATSIVYVRDCRSVTVNFLFRCSCARQSPKESLPNEKEKKTLFFLFPPLKIYLWAKLRAITCVQQPREITRRNETRLFRKGKKYIYIIPNESKSNQINKVANEMKWNKNFIFFFSFSFRSETEIIFLTRSTIK